MYIFAYHVEKCVGYTHSLIQLRAPAMGNLFFFLLSEGSLKHARTLAVWRTLVLVARQTQCMFPSLSLTVVPQKRYLTNKGSSTQIVCTKFSSSAIPTYRHFSISFWTAMLKVNTLCAFHMGIWDYSSNNFYSLSWTKSLSFYPLANTELNDCHFHLITFKIIQLKLLFFFFIFVFTNDQF